MRIDADWRGGFTVFQPRTVRVSGRQLGPTSPGFRARLHPIYERLELETGFDGTTLWFDDLSAAFEASGSITIVAGGAIPSQDIALAGSC